MATIVGGVATSHIPGIGTAIAGRLHDDPYWKPFFDGYPPVQYYPGADDARLAIPVAVPAGGRVRNLELRLRRTRLVEFSGRLIEMAGREPVVGAQMALAGA